MLRPDPELAKAKQKYHAEIAAKKQAQLQEAGKEQDDKGLQQRDQQGLLLLMKEGARCSAGMTGAQSLAYVLCHARHVMQAAKLLKREILPCETGTHSLHYHTCNLQAQRALHCNRLQETVQGRSSSLPTCA